VSYADPCPTAGGKSEHCVDLTNRRPNNVYRVEIVSVSIHALIKFDKEGNSIHEWVFALASASPGLHRASTALSVIDPRGNVDEISSHLSLYDATQKTGGNNFIEPAESIAAALEFSLPLR
jgi:hypothetical protein